MTTPSVLIPPAWAGWEHDEKLVAEYTRRITEHFHEAITRFAVILDAWWRGSLTMTVPGLIDTLEELLRESIGSVLRNLWQEAWYLGSRSASIAISHEEPDFGKWKPGRTSATAEVANEAGLRHLLNAYGRSVIEGIARTRMDKLAEQLRSAMTTSRTPDDLIARLEDILIVPARAPMIARTEIARSVAAAAVDEYRKAGVSRKEWAPDSAACPVCKENAAQGAIPFAADFIGGVHSPPQHPYCRCAIMPAQSQAVKKRKVKPPKSTWGGGWGGGARSSPHDEGHGYQPDQNYRPDQAPAYNPQQPPVYDPDELYVPGQSPSIADQRSGTSAPLNNAGGEPPRDEEEDDEDTDQPSQVDVNGQRGRAKKPVSNAAAYPYPSRGLPGGAPQGPEHGTQQPQGDPFTLPRRRAVETSQSGNDGNYPPRRGRPPNATGKALAELGELAQHLRGGGDMGSWQLRELPQAVLDVVKFDLADGQTLGTAMEDALLHLTKDRKVSKESVNYRHQLPGNDKRCGNCVMYSNHICDLVAGRIEPADVCDKWEARKDDGPGEVTHAGLIVRAADTGRILLLQRDLDKSVKAEDIPPVIKPGGRFKDEERDAADLHIWNRVPAEHIANHLRANYPEKALTWIYNKVRWIGPGLVPQDQIDYDDEDSWAASHQPGAIKRFMKAIKSGTGHTHAVVMVKVPGDNKIKIVDGHHRSTAYKRLGRPVKAYVGFVPKGDDRWMETHSSQINQGSSPANKNFSA